MLNEKITALKIPDNSYSFINNDDKKEQVLKNISKVNIFIGPNNAGKSRLLRKIISADSNEFNYHLSYISTQEINICTKKLKEDLLEFIEKKHMHQPKTTKILDEIQPIEFISSSMYLHSKLFLLKKELNSIAKTYPKVMKIYDKAFSALGENFEEKLKPPRFKKVYIPILRGLRPINLNDKNKAMIYDFDHKDTYKLRTQVDYFEMNPKIAAYGGPVEVPLSNPTNQPVSKPFEIFTGIDLYEDIKKMMLGTQEEKKRIREYEKYLSSNFFDNVAVTLTPKHDSDVLNITIGKEERPIYNLGDGLQTIIICTYPIFKYENENLLLFIEEPEIYLHPSLQRKLMNTFADENKNHQIFLSTHSNHFLDITLDYNEVIRIFSFQKKDENNFNIKNVSRNKEILDLIGVRNSSVFLSNCIIWVEGITDRLYIKKFMELYGQIDKNTKYEEDKQFSFIEYGGSCITHLNFDENNNGNDKINVESISKNNFLVADNDGFDFKSISEEPENTCKKEQRLRTFKKIFKDNFFAEQREIENILTPHIFLKYFKKKYKGKKYKLKEYYDLDLAKKEINEKPIGTLLKEHMIEYKNHSQDITDKDKNGKSISIIEDKLQFCDKICSLIDDEKIKFDDLSEEAQKLVKEIVRFIEENNKK